MNTPAHSHLRRAELRRVVVCGLVVSAAMLVASCGSTSASDPPEVPIADYEDPPVAESEVRSALLTEFRQKARRAAEIETWNTVVITRADPEMSQRPIHVLWAHEQVLGKQSPGVGSIAHWTSLHDEVRLSDDPAWRAALEEIVADGWTATDEPTPPPLDEWGRWMAVRGDAAPPGGTAPNGDLYVLSALELLARVESPTIEAAAIEYLETRRAYPQRQVRIIEVLRSIRAKGAVPPLLERVIAADDLFGVFRSACELLAELGDEQTLAALRRHETELAARTAAGAVAPTKAEKLQARELRSTVQNLSTRLRLSKP